MQRVLVLSSDKRPLDPCHPARARKLLRKGRAAVVRRYPFTIVLRDRSLSESVIHSFRLKFDPGSKTTGMAVVQEEENSVVWAAELTHRAQQIHEALLARRAIRQSRRNRKCRHRPPRFENRCRPDGWLPPSLQSRVGNVVTWVKRLQKLIPLTALSLELGKFDTQKLMNPEVSGVEYQWGELIGCEVRAYLLAKWNYECAYCHAKNVPLQVEHIVPRTRGGTDRVSNLTMACALCNRAKGSQTATEFGHPEVQKKCQQPLADAAAVNVTRWVIYRVLLETGLPLEVGTGGKTKFNRANLGLPKSHWIDAACVGTSGQTVHVSLTLQPLAIRATGRGCRQMCRVDRFGFPRTSAKVLRRVHGFQTGDQVKAVVTNGKKIGTYIGRLAVRASGYFNITTADTVAQGISWRYCRLLQRADGYAYSIQKGGGTL